jgi:predicted metal-dependent hydrolase
VADPVDARAFQKSLRKGVALFNDRRFWHAHEAWEEIWLTAESDTKEFLQGLIQLSAAYHHLERGTLRGAVRLFDAAIERLSTAEDTRCGIALAGLLERALRHREWSRRALEQAGGITPVDARLDDSEIPKILFEEPVLRAE